LNPHHLLDAWTQNGALRTPTLGHGCNQWSISLVFPRRRTLERLTRTRQGVLSAFGKKLLQQRLDRLSDYRTVRATDGHRELHVKFTTTSLTCQCDNFMSSARPISGSWSILLGLPRPVLRPTSVSSAASWLHEADCTPMANMPRATRTKRASQIEKRRTSRRSPPKISALEKTAVRIMRKLYEATVRTPAGRDRWDAKQVSRLLVA
jgi:hypothetical protein